jgi:hypothetical protein
VECAFEEDTKPAWLSKQRDNVPLLKEAYVKTWQNNSPSFLDITKIF